MLEREGLGRDKEESGKKPVSLKSDIEPASFPEYACTGCDGFRAALCMVEGVVCAPYGERPFGLVSFAGAGSGSEEEEPTTWWSDRLGSMLWIFSCSIGSACLDIEGDRSIISSSSSSIRASRRMSSTHSVASFSLGASMWKFLAGEKSPKTCLALRFGSFWRATAVRSAREMWCLSWVPSGGSL